VLHVAVAVCPTSSAIAEGVTEMVGTGATATVTVR
jgi:hypothetical protein